MHPLVGRTLGPYRIDAPLGKGGMGEVFRGYQPALDRAVAIKVLYAGLLADPGMEARFRQEAQAAARLRHSNIVQVYDFGDADGIFYMVMELIEGGSLRDELRRLQVAGRHMPLDDVAAVVEQVAAALDYAHARGVLHRDIKPDNIMLAEPGPELAAGSRRRAVLTDFGLAKLAGSSSLTRTGHIAGTPFYMAPEQFAAGPVDTRADVYALGIVLYELLTGRVPFEADTPPAVIYHHLQTPPPRPRDRRPDLPPPVDDVVLLALNKRPEDRYDSAGALARDLDRALRAAPDSAFVPTRALSPGTTAPATPSGLTTTPPAAAPTAVASQAGAPPRAAPAPVRASAPWAARDARSPGSGAGAREEALPFHKLRAELRPRRVSTRGAGRYRLTLANDGNTPVVLALRGADDEDALRFKMPESVTLAPGAEQTLKVRVGRRRGRLFGHQERYAFAIAAYDAAAARPGDIPAAQVNGEMIARGRIPAWLMTLVLLLALLAATAVAAYAFVDDLLPPEWATEVKRFVEPLVPPVWPSGRLAPPAAPRPGAIVARVNAPLKLRLRTGPGIAYPSIGQFEDGTALAPIEQHAGWFHVSGPAGADGWVSGRFLSFSAPPAGVPQAAAVPSVPPLGFRVTGVRVGTADGRRLRVVLDLERAGRDSSPLGLFEAPDPSPADQEFTVYVRAEGDAGLAPQYQSAAAREGAAVALAAAEDRPGLVLRITPNGSFFLRPVFLTPDDPPRVVIDLCQDQGCPAVP